MKVTAQGFGSRQIGIELYRESSTRFNKCQEIEMKKYIKTVYSHCKYIWKQQWRGRAVSIECHEDAAATRAVASVLIKNGEYE